MFPTVSVRGDARTRGQQYGEQAASLVRRSVDAYRDVFAHYAHWDWSKVTKEALRFVEPVRGYGQVYLAEMQGIAEGAGVRLEDIMAINVRTEVMFAAKARDASVTLPQVAECSAFVAIPPDERPVLAGQNWDWLTHAFDTTVILEAEREDGPRFVSVVEAGLLAKTGFNEHGLAICTNALVCDDDRGDPGVPYHVLLRAMLDARTPTEALTALQRAQRSSSANYLIAHRDGLGLGVEATPGDFSRLFVAQPDGRGLLLHTNHFEHPRFDRVDVSRWVMPDSLFRIQRLQRALAKADPYASSTYEAVLTDHAGHPAGLCCHPDPSYPEPEQGATVLSLVMDLDALTMRLAEGQPCETGYRTLDYKAFLTAPRAAA